jgi:hypothetical protein
MTTRRSVTRLALVGISLLLAAAVALGATLWVSSRRGPVASATASNPLPAPRTGVYLGAFANPDGVNGSAHGGLGAYAQLVTLEGQIHRKMAIDLHYSSWQAPLASASVVDDIVAGRIALISWGCGATDAAVASGADDALLVSQARAVAALHAPVMIRWFWEMEYTGSNGGAQGRQHAACLGSAGPSGYIAAWRHIVTVFRANGATNVAWVFCPGSSSYGPNALRQGVAAASYYPGNAYVDWIGEDAYSRSTYTPFATLVSGLVHDYGAAGKPLIVCETGAEAPSQAEYLSGIQSGLKATAPAIRAIVYFDSHGPLGSYVLDSAGLDALRALGADPYFAAMPPRRSLPAP